MMTEENRKDIVLYRIEKADKTLSDAQKSLNFGMFNVAANRLYYAFYYIASALLISIKVEAHTHSGVQSMMHLHFIKTGILPESDGVLMRRLFVMRQESDYEDFVEVQQTDIEALYPSVVALIDRIKGLISL